MKTFAIDFVRQAIEQTLLEEHIKNPSKYFGGKNQVNLFSFYEQLEKEDAVDRYVEIYNDLVNQQNRTGLIMNGTLVTQENPTITNVSTALIIPMAFTCSFRVRIEDRDMALETLNNMVDCLKGRKHDIAMFEDGTLFKVGTVCNQVDDSPSTRNGDYIGEHDNDFSIDSDINENIKPYFEGMDIYFANSNGTYYYMTDYSNGTLMVVRKNNNVWERIYDDGTYNHIVFPKDNQEFEKFSLSISFDSQKCDNPVIVNGDEYCVIYFGGSATLVSHGVRLGNEMTKLGIAKKMIKAKPDIDINGNYTWLEPLELPSGNSADTKINSLLSNNFVNNSHTNSLNISTQYTFICDKNIELLNHWFKYARYGIQGTQTNSYNDGVTPNMIYKVREYWSSWGEVEKYDYLAKIVESIDIENSESDVLTITIPLQVQGAN